MEVRTHEWRCSRWHVNRLPWALPTSWEWSVGAIGRSRGFQIPYIEIYFIKITIRLENNVHIVETGDLFINQSLVAYNSKLRTDIFVTAEMMQQSELTSGIEKSNWLIRTYLISLKHRLVRIRWRDRIWAMEGLYISHHPYLRIDVRDFLDGASFARTTMPCSYNTTIGALTQFFDKLVLRVYHKVWV